MINRKILFALALSAAAVQGSRGPATPQGSGTPAAAQGVATTSGTGQAGAAASTTTRQAGTPAGSTTTTAPGGAASGGTVQGGSSTTTRPAGAASSGSGQGVSVTTAAGAQSSQVSATVAQASPGSTTTAVAGQGGPGQAGALTGAQPGMAGVPGTGMQPGTSAKTGQSTTTSPQPSSSTTTTTGPASVGQGGATGATAGGGAATQTQPAQIQDGKGVIGTEDIQIVMRTEDQKYKGKMTKDIQEEISRTTRNTTNGIYYYNIFELNKRSQINIDIEKTPDPRYFRVSVRPLAAHKLYDKTNGQNWFRIVLPSTGIFLELTPGTVLDQLKLKDFDPVQSKIPIESDIAPLFGQVLAKVGKPEFEVKDEVIGGKNCLILKATLKPKAQGIPQATLNIKIDPNNTYQNLDELKNIVNKVKEENNGSAEDKAKENIKSIIREIRTLAINEFKDVTNKTWEDLVNKGNDGTQSVKKLYA